PVDAARAGAAGKAAPPLLDHSLMVLLGVVFLLAVMLFAFVYLLRRRIRGTDSEFVYRAGSSGRPPSSGRRRRRRRRADAPLPRNPTLAETGGLPPPRDEGDRTGGELASGR
ncbi:MAG TPA: hypothetical protein VNO52_06475, partial [Methylomirabilota bacterium]|nr:hypothetical protein [Methylomirabilota bacterium]